VTETVCPNVPPVSGHLIGGSRPGTHPKEKSMSVGRICTRVVATAVESEAIREAARRMKEKNVGTLVVVDDEGGPKGIVTDRDLVVRCLAEDLDPDRATLAQVMTRSPWTVDEDTPVSEAVALMDRHGVRRLLVTGEGVEVSGIVSVDDVILLLATEAARLGGVLSRDIPRLGRD
jgi:CBS domain-containing protein